VKLDQGGFTGIDADDLDEETTASLHGLELSSNHIDDLSFIGVIPEVLEYSY
jgi:hypothetical protein